MKKLYPETADVAQGVANRAVRIIEKHLRQSQVDRAKDLTEEARVSLFRDLGTFFESEAGGGQIVSKGRGHGLLARLAKRLEEFLSFSESSSREYLPLVFCPCVAYCDGFRQSYVPVVRVGVADSDETQVRGDRD
jgi:hypothetical protein